MSAQIFDASFVPAKGTRHCTAERDEGKGFRREGKGTLCPVGLCPLPAQLSRSLPSLYIQHALPLPPSVPLTQAAGGRYLGSQARNKAVDPEGPGPERDGTCTCTPPRQNFFDKKSGIQLIAGCLLFVFASSLLEDKR